jgi:hypothetical protein
MIILETKHIPKIKETLVFKDNKCFIQDVQDELGILDEYIIPCLYGDENDICVHVDDILLGLIETHEYMCVHLTFVKFGLIQYEYNRDRVDHFVTKLPSYEFLCVLPDFKFDCEVILRKSMIHLDNGLTYDLELLHKNVHKYGREFSIRINGRYLEPGFCKVYKDDNFPVCLEYFKDGYIKRRFISPIEE